MTGASPTPAPVPIRTPVSSAFRPPASRREFGPHRARRGCAKRTSRWVVRGFDDDKGAMTVTTAFIVAFILALTLAVLLIARAAVAGHAARSAADLAALAGAHAVREGDDGCATASGVAAANGASAPVCTVDGRDVVVRAEVGVDLGLFGMRAASAVARAGPV